MTKVLEHTKLITGEVAAQGLIGQNCSPQEYEKKLSDAGVDADNGKGGLLGSSLPEKRRCNQHQIKDG
jgi:hypothetical protein